MAGLKDPKSLNMETNDEAMNENYFNLRMKDHYKIYSFKNKNVHSIFNLLANFIGNKLTGSDRNQAS